MMRVHVTVYLMDTKVTRLWFNNPGTTLDLERQSMRGHYGLHDQETVH